MDTTKARENFERLKEEHAKAIKVTKGRVKKWEQFKSDYESLQARLSTLPDKVTYDIMVPFGKFAFMPGQLYHTNEILVLLGDNWFVERSAQQAAAIAERRKQQVIRLLEDEKKQQTDWEERLDFTSDLEAPLKEHGDMVEIREECTGEVEHEKKRREHTSDPLKSRAHPPLRVSFNPSKAATKTQPDEALWKRLNELEEEEEMEEKKRVEELGAEEAALASSTGAPASSTGAPASSTGAPASSTGAPASSTGAPASSTGAPASSTGAPASSTGAPASSTGAPASSTGAPASSTGALASSTGALASSNGALASSTGALASSTGALASSTGILLAPTQNTLAVAERPSSPTITTLSTDAGGQKEQLSVPTPLRLVFSHSSPKETGQLSSGTIEHNNPAASEASEDEIEKASCKAVFSSPADIFRSKSIASEDLLKEKEKSLDETSVRKSVSWNTTLAKSEEYHERGHKSKPPVHQTTTAFSGQVVERVTQPLELPADPTRKVSKFKASRQK